MIASLFIGNVMLLVLNLPLAPVWARMLRIPRPYLYAGIVLFAALGVYALNNSWVDLLVLYVLGVLGFAMRRYGLPLAPAIIGIILGPLSEIQLRGALSISAGDASVLVTSPIAVILLVLSAAVQLVPEVIDEVRDREVHARQTSREVPGRPRSARPGAAGLWAEGGIFRSPCSPPAAPAGRSRRSSRSRHSGPEIPS